jgi:hypothetical protein
LSVGWLEVAEVESAANFLLTDLRILNNRPQPKMQDVGVAAICRKVAHAATEYHSPDKR